MAFVFRGRTLPDDLKASLDAYIEDGRPTGDFLQACINNDLNRAIGFADEISLNALPAVTGYLYNEAPSGCWGKPDSFKNWIEAKRKEREASGEN